MLMILKAGIVPRSWQVRRSLLLLNPTFSAPRHSRSECLWLKPSGECLGFPNDEVFVSTFPAPRCSNPGCSKLRVWFKTLWNFDRWSFILPKISLQRASLQLFLSRAVIPAEILHPEWSNALQAVVWNAWAAARMLCHFAIVSGLPVWEWWMTQQGVSSKEQSKDLLGSSSSLGRVVQLCQEDNMSEIWQRTLALQSSEWIGNVKYDPCMYRFDISPKWWGRGLCFVCLQQCSFEYKMPFS